MNCFLRHIFKLSIFLFVFTIGLTKSSAQNTYIYNDYNVILFGGSSHFFGDLGGSNRKGSNSPFDLNMRSTGYSIGFGVSKRLSERFSVRVNFIEAKVRGSDVFTTDAFRRNRNLHFRSAIQEITAIVDFDILTINRFGERPHKLFIFAGVGGFKFNPQAQYKGTWYDLQPMGTEGQGLIPGTSKYKKTGMDIPFGLGYNITISNKQQIGLLLTMRKTFTDYIDDVSDKYYDNKIITEQRGEVAGYLADPNLQRSAGVVAPSGAGRGDPRNNDNFAFIQLTYSLGLSFKKDRHPFKLNSDRSNKKCPKW